MLRRPSLALPRNILVQDVADSSRRALRAFLTLEPDKRALSAWLVGPYREATSYGPRRVKSMQSDAPHPHHTNPTNIEDLVTMTKALVTTALEAAQHGVDDLVELLPPVVEVIPVHDVYGNHGFVPVDESRMRLGDRVLGLLVGDYLTRTTDFLEAIPALTAPVPPVSGVHLSFPGMERTEQSA